MQFDTGLLLPASDAGRHAHFAHLHRTIERTHAEPPRRVNARSRRHSTLHRAEAAQAGTSGAQAGTIRNI